jgi:hypothetical protein
MQYKFRNAYSLIRFQLQLINAKIQFRSVNKKDTAKSKAENLKPIDSKLDEED